MKPPSDEPKKVPDLDATAPAPTAREDVVAHGPGRCPGCQDRVDAAKQAWLLCSKCLARHHASCWAARCARCGDTSPPLGDGAPARRRVPGLLLGASMTLVVVVIVTSYYREPPLQPSAVPSQDLVTTTSSPHAPVAPPASKGLDELAAELERASARTDVAGVGCAVDALRDALRRSSDHVTLAAAVAPLMSAVTAHPHAGTRAAAAGLLGRLGDAAATPALRHGSQDGEFTVRLASMEALTALGRPACLAALEEIRSGLRHPSHGITEASVAALRVVGPGGEAALPELVDTMRRERLNEAGLRLLVVLGRRAPDHAMPALIECLQHDPSHVRLIATKIVGFLGPSGHEAVPALAQILEEPNVDQDLARAVVAALATKGTGAAPAGEALLRVARGGSGFEDIRVSSLQVLATLPSTDTARLEALDDLAKRDSSPVVRDAAKQAAVALRAGGGR